MSEKILKAVFVILIVVFLGELGYLYYSSQKPVAVPAANQISDTLPVTPTRPADALLIQQQVDLFSNLKKNPNQKVVVSIETEGVIGKITERSDEKLSIKIMANDETEILSYIWNKEPVDDLNIYLRQGEVDTPIQVTDLLVGDRISINDVHDITKGLVTIDVVVTRQ